MIYIKDIEKAIIDLGIENSEICIHSSMKTFGDQIEGGIKGLVQAFLNVDCTIMTPAFSYEFMQNPVDKYMPERNGIDYETAFNPLYDRSKIFNPDSKSISTEKMGKLPECILNEPGSTRGNHPINSFTAIGKNAARLTGCQTVKDVYAPFRQLMEDDGYILLMGVGLDRATIIHHAEQLAGRELFIYWANNSDGEVIPVKGGGCSSGFNNFLPFFDKGKEIVVGKSLWQCRKAREIVDVCRKAITENPRITHCGNPECRRCNDGVLGGPIINFDI